MTANYPAEVPGRMIRLDARHCVRASAILSVVAVPVDPTWPPDGRPATASPPLKAPNAFVQVVVTEHHEPFYVALGSTTAEAEDYAERLIEVIGWVPT